MGMLSELDPNRTPSSVHPFVNNPTGDGYDVRSSQVKDATKVVKSLYSEETKRGNNPDFALLVKEAGRLVCQSRRRHEQERVRFPPPEAPAP